MAELTWTAESGADGATITTGNSGGASGDAWDLVTIGTAASALYDATSPPVGKRSARFVTAGTAAMAYAGWQSKIAARWPSGMTTNYWRTYFKTSAIPSADRTVVEFTDAAGTTGRGNLRLRSTGALRIRDAANGTVTTTTTILSPNTWYRIEGRLDGSVTGAWQLNLYLGQSVTPLESLSGTANFGGVIGTARFGWVANIANSETWNMAGINVNDVGLPGPLVYAAITPGVWCGPRCGAAMLPAHDVADDFADNSVNTSLWSTFSFGSVTGQETGGQYQFDVTTAGTGAGRLFTQSRYDLRGDYFAAELTNAGVQESGLQAYAAMAEVDGNNQVYITVANNFMGAIQNVGGSISGLNFVAYNPALHRWFRIREAAGTTYWEVSASGVSGWTAIHSAVNPIPLSDVTLLIATDTFLTLGGAKTVTFGGVAAPVLTT